MLPSIPSGLPRLLPETFSGVFGQVFGRLWSLIFGQVFGQIFWGQNMQFSVLLGRRNTVESTTRPEKADYLLFNIRNPQDTTLYFRYSKILVTLDIRDTYRKERNHKTADMFVNLLLGSL